MENCPCGTDKDYQACCALYISGKALPATAEQLMRSRYTAYTQANATYLLDTMRSPAADRFDLESTRAWANKVSWLKLEVIQSEQKETEGTVEFIAHFRMDNKRYVLHEISKFKLIDQQWFYTDGQPPSENSGPVFKKISRNDICPCGSNQKYKKCCGNLKN